LAPVFAAVADPFPSGRRLVKNRMTQADKDRIVALRRGGMAYREIARECGTTTKTVTLCLRKAGLVKRKR
jgi:hypothetical protein